MQELGPAECRAKAIELLARREHSVRELSLKLQQRDFNSALIDEVLGVLQNERLLSDERFAEEYIRARSNKGIGPLRLRQELAERGVSSELSDCFLDDGDWPQRVVDVRVKKFGSVLPTDFKDRAKQTRFLQYRGFTAEQIRLAINNDDWE